MKLITSLFALVAFTGASFGADAAADKPKRSPEEMFKKLDANSDGGVTLDEFKTNKKDADKAEQQFKKRDKDGDGKVTLEEMTAGKK